MWVSAEQLPLDLVESRLAGSNVPGAAIAVIRSGELAWTAGYGRRWATMAGQVDAQTVFGAASVSKAITALAIFGLAENGYLDLDQDVRPLLAFPLEAHPHLAARSFAPGPVTARLLLQHTGGVVGRGTTPGKTRAGFLAGSVGGGSCRFLQPVADPVRMSLASTWFGGDGRPAVEITYPPGSRYSYSGAGYLVLQHLLEQVTGERFQDHLARVLAGYGAANATFALDPETGGNFAAGHSPDGCPLPGGHELIPWSAAGGLYSDVRSLAAVLCGVLRADPGVAGSQHRSHFMAGAGTSSITRSSGEAGFTHGGDNSGYRAVWTGYPRSGDGVVVLTNGRGTDGTDLRSELSRWALA